MADASGKRAREDDAPESSSSSSSGGSASSSSASSAVVAAAGGRGGGGGGGASRDELLALVGAREAGHAAVLAAREAGHAAALAACDAGHATVLGAREAGHAAALAALGAGHAAALGARDAASAQLAAQLAARDAQLAARDAALAAAGAERAAIAAELEAERALTRAVLARDATLASALADRDALRRRLALPNVRAALRGEDFLDVIGIVSSVGYAADVSQCRELCRLTRDIVQRGDVADMLAQSLRLQCGAREARAAACEDFVLRAKDVGDDDDEDYVVEGTTQLTRAAILNNLPRVLQLIQLGAPLDLVDATDGCSALHRASVRGNEHVAKALLDGKYEGRGATVDLRDKHDSSPLINASYQSGTEGVVRLLLSRGAKQELQNVIGLVAMHVAAANNKPGNLALLCAAPGAAAALAMKSAELGATPLAFALMHGHAACEAVLRAHGALE